MAQLWSVLGYSIVIILCVTEKTEVKERMECCCDPASSEEVEEEKDSREGERDQRESQAESCSHHPEQLEAVHGGEEEV